MGADRALSSESSQDTLETADRSLYGVAGTASERGFLPGVLPNEQIEEWIPSDDDARGAAVILQESTRLVVK